MTIPRVPPDPTRPEGYEGPATSINLRSHWWDLSSIYGNNAEEQARLRTGSGGEVRLDPEGLGPVVPGAADAMKEPGFWLGLAMMHRLFGREHNAICHRLAQEYLQWADDTLFEHARLINAALVAKIHTVEWTPAIISHPTAVTGLRANWWDWPAGGPTNCPAGSATARWSAASPARPPSTSGCRTR